MLAGLDLAVPLGLGVVSSLHCVQMCAPVVLAYSMGGRNSATGIPFETDFKTSRGGHTWEYVDAMARPVMDFIATRLEQESRRLS